MKRFYLHSKGNMQQGRGFTLVELMVSLTVFSIIMLISTGVLLIMIDVNAKGQALYSSYSNLAFALDSMTREIRTGRNYYCSTTAGTNFPTNGSVNECTGGRMIVFNRGWSNEQMGYRVFNNRIEQKITAAGTWYPITADEVLVDSFSLIIDNVEEVGGEEQPYVNVSIAGELYNGLVQATEFNISTRVVQRVLDR